MTEHHNLIDMIVSFPSFEFDDTRPEHHEDVNILNTLFDNVSFCVENDSNTILTDNNDLNFHDILNPYYFVYSKDIYTSESTEQSRRLVEEYVSKVSAR